MKPKMNFTLQTQEIPYTFSWICKVELFPIKFVMVTKCREFLQNVNLLEEIVAYTLYKDCRNYLSLGKI